MRKIVYNSKAESFSGNNKSKADAMNLDIRAGGPCAAAGREPCQAGNRAALTGVSLCDAVSLSVRISKRMTPRQRPVLLSIYPVKRGEGFVSGFIPQMEAQNVF